MSRAMNIASLELCQKLFELSGWIDTEYGWLSYSSWETDEVSYELSKRDKKRWCAGAYDAGYLLRKLPSSDAEGYKLQIRCDDTDYWYAGYYKRDNSQLKTESNPCATPEEAACQLAINLFKEGVLTRGE